MHALIWPSSQVKSRQVTNHQLCFLFKFKILGSECQTSGTCATRAKQATKKTTPRLACVFWTT
jgi:hypothetical protein